MSSCTVETRARPGSGEWGVSTGELRRDWRVTLRPPSVSEEWQLVPSDGDTGAGGEGPGWHSLTAVSCKVVLDPSKWSTVTTTTTTTTVTHNNNSFMRQQQQCQHHRSVSCVLWSEASVNNKLSERCQTSCQHTWSWSVINIYLCNNSPVSHSLLISAQILANTFTKCWSEKFLISVLLVLACLHWICMFATWD